MAYSNVPGMNPSTIDFRLATVTIARGSTTEHQEVVVIGDAVSSLGIAPVLAVNPKSTDFGLTVRIAGGPSSAVDCTIRALLSSTSTDNPVRAVLSATNTDNPVRAVLSSTNTDNPVTTTPASTGWVKSAGMSVDSSNYLNIKDTPASTAWVKNAGFSVDSSNYLNVNASFTGSTTVTVARTVGNSSAADYMPVRFVDSSGTGFANFAADFTDGSTASVLVAPGLAYANGSNTTMRLVGITQPFPIQDISQVAIATTASTNAFAASTSLTIMSSAASTRAYVVAYTITTTNAGPSKVAFFTSNTLLWPVMLAAVSSAITGVNLCASYPSYIFRTSASEALSLRIKGSTIGGWHVGVSYFSAS